MPTVRANNVNLYYEKQGTGEPLVLIPYLAADQTCYAFQVADYAKHFTCISVDLRGAGQSDKPDSPYSTELFADDVAAFMQAIGVEKAPGNRGGREADQDHGLSIYARSGTPQGLQGSRATGLSLSLGEPVLR
jgi:hypothetical protein